MLPDFGDVQAVAGWPWIVDRHAVGATPVATAHEIPLRKAGISGKQEGDSGHKA